MGGEAVFLRVDTDALEGGCPAVHEAPNRERTCFHSLGFPAGEVEVWIIGTTGLISNRNPHR